MRINESPKGESGGRRKDKVVVVVVEEGVATLGFVARPQWQEWGKEFLGEKRTAKNQHVDRSRARACSLILCFLGYLMKY